LSTDYERIICAKATATSATIKTADATTWYFNPAKMFIEDHSAATSTITA